MAEGVKRPLIWLEKEGSGALGEMPKWRRELKVPANDAKLTGL